MSRILSQRELNRTLLARQQLLARSDMAPLAMVEQLAGLQSQIPNPPYIGLWTRLQEFQRDDLTRLLATQQVVRAAMDRSTLHLVSAADHQRIRPLLQPALERALAAFFGKRASGLEIAPLVAAARDLFAEGPRTTGELRAYLLTVAPAADGDALAYAVRTHLPLVQVPPAGSWGTGSGGAYLMAEQVLDPAIPPLDLAGLFRRYLVAFGPASVLDFQTYTGLTKLRPLTAELTAGLTRYQDVQGRDLFDLPDLPILPADTPAPPRFVPEYDNLLLAHADRTRIIADADKPQVFLSAGRVLGTVLLDGFVAGTWKAERSKQQAVLRVQPFTPLSPAMQAALAAEGERLLRFIEEQAASYQIEF